MSFKDIKELRQAGKLDEALTMANQALEEDPENIWNLRGAAWVYYDYLKQYSNPDTLEVNSFKEMLLKIRELNLPENENMVFDNCAWQIGKLVFTLQKQENVDFGSLNELFGLIKDFHFTKPSDAYTFIYRAFHKGNQNWSGYLTFADWWNFEYFLHEDYISEEFKDKKIMSIAERAYMAYSKKLLEGELEDPFALQKKFDKDKIQTFLSKLDHLIEQYPDYQYLPYFKAKLLLVSGADENVLSAFLPFARQKRNDFWVWELLAEISSHDKEIQFACFCKALSLKTPEDFLVKLRQTFAAILVEKSMFEEAKTEIQKVITTREKHEWKLPNQLTQWTEMEWYKLAVAKSDNRDLYMLHEKKAEEILFQDIPQEIIVVDFVNAEKTILNFVKDKKKFGFFKYSGFFKKPKTGDILKVRFNDEGNDGFFKILTAEKEQNSTSSEAIKTFEGVLKTYKDQPFGFVDDIFVMPNLIKDKGCCNGDLIRGKALLSFDKKKDKWGWKAFVLD